MIGLPEDFRQDSIRPFNRTDLGGRHIQHEVRSSIGSEDGSRHMGQQFRTHHINVKEAVTIFYALLTF